MAVNIVIPSFKGHFSEVERFLESHSKYNKDLAITTIHLVVGDSEVDLFAACIDKYPHTFICIHSFTVLMKKYFHEIEEGAFLKAYGKETFQSFKKLCGMLETQKGCRIFLTDSETYFIRDCHLSKEVYSTDNIFYAHKTANPTQAAALSIASNIVNAKEPIPWIGLVFHYQWIFERDMIDDLYSQCKKDIITQTSSYFFVEILLYSWIWTNKDDYPRVKFVDMTHLFVDRCPEHFWAKYDDKSIRDEAILHAVLSSNNVFCYSVQNEGRYSENYKLISTTPSIKILTSTPESFKLPSRNAKTVAVLLRGISYGTYTHFSKIKYTIDFRDNFENINAMLLQPMRYAGMDVDVYGITYEHAHMNALRELYKPVELEIVKEPIGDAYVMYMMSKGLETLARQVKTYDLVIMTRFDINMKVGILELPYDESKINFTCKTHDGGVDDTLIVFGGSHLSLMLDTISSNIRCDLQHRLNGYLPESSIQYMTKHMYTSITHDRPYILFNRELYSRFTPMFNINGLLWHVLYKSYGAMMKGCGITKTWAFIKRPCATIRQGFSYSSIFNGKYVIVSFDIRFISEIPAVISNPWSINGNVKWLNGCKQGTFSRVNVVVKATSEGNIVWDFSDFSPEVHLHIKNISINISTHEHHNQAAINSESKGRSITNHRRNAGLP